MRFIVTAAMNGTAIPRVYWKLYCGRKLVSQAAVPITPSERWAVAVLNFVVVLGGLIPHPVLNSR